MVRSDERGVTLLELMIALLLLAVALIGLAASFPLGMYGVTLGGFQTTATLLAQQAIEQARAGTYGGIPSLATGGCDASAGTGTYAAVPGYPGFSRCISVQPATPTTTTTTFTVAVRFSTGGGAPVETRFATILTQ